MPSSFVLFAAPGTRSVRLTSAFRTATFRLVAVYVAVFAASVAVLGIILFWTAGITLEHQINRHVEREMARLHRSFRSGGFDGLLRTIRERDNWRQARRLIYLVLDASNNRLAGAMSAVPAGPGWSELKFEEPSGEVGNLRVLAAKLDGGGLLAVGKSTEQLDEIRTAILNAFAAAFGAVLVVGIVGGFALSMLFLSRVETITRTAEAIIAGDLSQRIPTRGTDDDFDRLALTLNRMLDRIADLIDSLKQVSSDVAHDLRTPLSRLRQELEAAQRHLESPAQHEAVLASAIANVDEILATFSALLRIAQIGAGTRRAGFRELDLSSIFTTVVEAFGPAAEDAGKSMRDHIVPNIRINGDRELLVQLLANLVENAIRHTPDGTRIEVLLGREGDRIVGCVADNGPGVPASESERIFRRFYRLECSRSSSGSGLGLSMAAAISELHGIKLEAQDNGPGLRMVLNFPCSRSDYSQPYSLEGRTTERVTCAARGQK
jgi:signal transduction histidine kinase